MQYPNRLTNYGGKGHATDLIKIIVEPDCSHKLTNDDYKMTMFQIVISKNTNNNDHAFINELFSN